VGPHDLHIEYLDDSRTDFSVLSEQLSKIGPARDLHIGEIRPGCIRGNHFHTHRRELIAADYHASRRD
jgi:hypothetical protein